MKQKSQPQRLCVGCNELKDKKNLVRIVMNKDGQVFLDTTGKAPGRGAYVCPQASCFEQAYKQRRLERSLKHQVSQEVYEALREEIGHE